MKSSYRLDIQGLRAISVLVVFCAHANWYPFSGGFVGVDIFFVISGYVISMLIFEDYKKNKEINFLKFYARRIQRLLPALYTVIIFSSFIAFFILTPQEQYQQYDAAISSVLWISNIYFIDIDINYFAQLASKNLYLHTWSLAVEEQFYLLWPIVILLGFKFSKKSKRDDLIGVAVIIIFVIILSIILLVYFTLYNNNFAFYLMPTRAWQFGLGALIAVLHFKKPIIPKKNHYIFLYELLAMLGVMLLMFSILLFEKSTPYPNWQVLLPTVGAGFLLLAKYQSGYTFIGGLLSSPILIFLGNISYSFYLWHWPVLFFCKKMIVYYHWTNTIFALCLTLILSILSYYLIEMPLRNNIKLRSNYKIIYFATTILMIIVFFILLTSKSFSTNLKSDQQQFQYNQVAKTMPILYDQGCDDWYHSDSVKACRFGNKNAKNKVIIFGDSILVQWFPALLEYYNNKKWEIIVYTKSGCPIINRPFFYYRIMSEYKKCETWRNSVIKEISYIRPKTVIIGNSTGYPFSEEEWKTGTVEIVNTIMPYTHDMKLISGTPGLSFDGPLCLARTSWLSKFFPHVSESSCAEALKIDKTWQWQNDMILEFTDIKLIEMSKFVCPNNLCQAKRNQTVIYRDSIHLSVEFVKSIQGDLNVALSK